MRARDTQNLTLCDSCGLEQFHVGEQIDRRARELLSERNIPCDAIRARRLKHDDFYNFDWILAMDQGHLAHLKMQARRENDQEHSQEHSQKNQGSKRATLALFLDKTSPGAEVLDPYYGAKSDFRRMLDDIEQGVRDWLDFFANIEHLPQNFRGNAPPPDSKA